MVQVLSGGSGHSVLSWGPGRSALLAASSFLLWLSLYNVVVSIPD